MDQGEEAGSASLKEDALDFALWKAHQGGRGHVVGFPVGPGPPGLAHRVLGDGREDPRHGLRDPRRRARPRLPSPRERGRPDRGGRGASRWRESGCTTGWSSWPRRRCRSPRETSSGSPRPWTPTVARPWSRFSSPATTASPSSSPTGPWPRPRRASSGFATSCASPPSMGRRTPTSRSSVRRCSSHSPTTSIPRGPSAALFELIAEANRRPLPGARAAVADACRCWGSSHCWTTESDADAEAERLVAERDEARTAGDYDRADELRDELAARGYDVRDGPDGGRLVPR